MASQLWVTSSASSHRFCGMRRPSLGVQQNDEDGDLSRLAVSPVDNVTFSTTNSSTSSNTSSSSSSSGSSSNPANGSNLGKQSANQSAVLRSQESAQPAEDAIDAVTYLPKIIELEWQPTHLQHHHHQQQQQNHRKRKERLDSTSSNSQTDRKVVRSNNEEQLLLGDNNGGGGGGGGGEGVFESEALIGDGKHALPDGRATALVEDVAEEQKPLLDSETGVNHEKPVNHHHHLHSSSSPLKSQSAHHPHLLLHSVGSVGHHHHHHQYHHNNNSNNSKKNGGALLSQSAANSATSTAGDDHYSDGEHERRRSSERFCRSRAPHGRKSSSCSNAKKSSSSLAGGGGAGGGGGGGKYYSRAAALSLRNNQNEEGQGYKYDLSALKSERRGFSSRDSQKMKKHKEAAVTEGKTVDGESEQQMDVIEDKSTATASAVPAPLPWNEFPDEMPVVCPRFAENTFEHVINVSDKFVKINPPSKKENSIKYVNNENIKTRDIMKKYGSQNSLQGGNNNNNNSWSKNRNASDLRLMIITPDERVRQINGRLTKLKKRIVQYEDVFERDYGHRPEKVETMNDKAMKTIMTEMQKLKRERQMIKTCDVVSTGGGGLVTPILGMGSAAASMFGGLKEIAHETQLLSGDMKMNKMQETLTDIETVLQERRKEDCRQEPLEKLSMEQLLHEKTAVQRGLLYLEGMFGRPNSKEERDLARPLYDRYRQIKRMLNRNSSMISASVDLPTILEHEAMVFTSTNNTPSTDATPPESQINETKKEEQELVTDDSSSLNDNLHQLSISELWHQLDLVRDEKKALRRTIKEFEQQFEEESGRKMLRGDRKAMEDTYALYKQKKGRLRLLDALVKKHMAY